MKSYLGWKIDFENPPGANALAGPDSVHWAVYKNPVALLVGGMAAVLLEFAEPKIRSGVWTHSTFKRAPFARARRTAMAAMVGVYGPEAAARRVIAGVNAMHARVRGQTPSGEPYQALDPELLDWVSATAGYGFLTAYDRFVRHLSEADKNRFYAEARPIALLYGAQRTPNSELDFLEMMAALAPRFEPHPIIGAYIEIMSSGRGAPFLPRRARQAALCAAISLLPPGLREALNLGPIYDLSPGARAMIQTLGAIADRAPLLTAPPAQACARIGLPRDFLYRSVRRRAEMLDRWRPRRSRCASRDETDSASKPC